MGRHLNVDNACLPLRATPILPGGSAVVGGPNRRLAIQQSGRGLPGYFRGNLALLVAHTSQTR